MTEEETPTQEEPTEAPETEVPAEVEPEAPPAWEAAGFESEQEYVDKAKNLKEWEKKLRHESMDAASAKPEPPVEPEEDDGIELDRSQLKVLEKAMGEVLGVAPSEVKEAISTARSYTNEASSRAKKSADKFFEDNPTLDSTKLFSIIDEHGLGAKVVAPEDVGTVLESAARIYRSDPEIQKAEVDRLVDARIKELTNDGKDEVVGVKPIRRTPDGSPADPWEQGIDEDEKSRRVNAALEK